MIDPDNTDDPAGPVTTTLGCLLGPLVALAFLVLLFTVGKYLLDLVR